MRALALAAVIGLAAPAEAICLRDRGPETIDVVTEVGANNDMATAIDIVFVSTADADQSMPKSGPEWFAKKAALLAGHGPAITVVSLQLPPAATTTVRRPKGVCRPASVLVFANMLSAGGQPAMTLTGDGALRIRATHIDWTPIRH